MGRRLIIGITGGIGSGKSIVSRILRCNGCKVFDCDFEAKKIMNEDNLVKNEIIKIAGSQSYNDMGYLNREYLSDVIYSSQDIRNKINQIVHQSVKDKFLNFTEEWHDHNVYIEAALLRGSSLINYCNQIWIINTSEKNQIERVIKRSNITETRVKEIIKAQKGEFEDLPQDNIHILQNDDIHPLLSKIIKIMNQNNKIIC